ncbi:hypothetical protein [Methanoplanus limicola]|uniref:hypothetical protein n=1 Tax=Methanoplanus limicola TaxID=2315 RepID=UPI00064E2088|nr:hypothetical protein [Methanoplanus limicola]
MKSGFPEDLLHSLNTTSGRSLFPPSFHSGVKSSLFLSGLLGLLTPNAAENSGHSAVLLSPLHLLLRQKACGLPFRSCEIYPAEWFFSDYPVCRSYVDENGPAVVLKPGFPEEFISPGLSGGSPSLA